MTPTQLAKSGSEHGEQRALFAWATMAQRYGLTAADDDKSYSVAGYADDTRDNWHDYIPQLKWMHAIHNQGHGDAIRGSKAKAEGVKAGVADIFLPVATARYAGSEHNFAGLYIEMKKAVGGTVSAEQSDFHAYALQAGYNWQCCHGWKAARVVLLKYLGLGAMA